ncbi:hypothetical protein NT6N_11650 [Oceaniferula spumae]|uniref:DUF3618 domain-containing protein n=1 Tax=Oceaniferula spumae TaxID=2979115 RepID=A0AAT9FJG1_9BACT
MAKKEQIALRKQALVAQLADSRQMIDLGRAELKEKLQVKKQFRRLIDKKPKQVFYGALVSGLAATLMLKGSRKKKKSKVRKSFFRLLIGWVLLALKPIGKSYLLNLSKTMAVAQMKSLTQPRQPHLETNDYTDAPNVR